MAAQMKDEKQILSNVIQEIKKKAKKKVDKKRIATLLTARHGLSSDEVEAMLTRLEAEGFINQKLDEKGDLCYAISKPAPFESEDSKLEDTVSPRILNVGASKEGDTAEPFPNPLPPTVNPDNAVVFSTLEALARGLDSTNQLLHQERAFSKAILQENLELKIKIKELEVKNSHLLDDVILRGASRIQRADENDRDADPLDELFFPRNKKQLNSEGSKVIHDDTIQSDGFQVVRPRRLRSNIQRESLPVVSIESGSESEGDLGSESSCAKNQLKTGKSNNMKGSSLNITRKEPQKSSNPNNINSEILENTERKDQQQASQTNKSKSKNLQNNRDKSAQRKGNRKNKVNLNDRSQCEGTEEAKNSERKGGQQRETTSQRVKITIVGDSQLKRLDETKLSNHHHQVEIIAKGGSRIRQATQQVGKSESDIIVVHAGTNDIKSSNPEALSDAIIETLNKIQQNNPSSQIAYSSIFRRNDKNDLTPNRKVTEVNKIIEEKLNLHGFDFINNSNILFCNLWKDGLHINDGGIRKFAGNLSSYFRYC